MGISLLNLISTPVPVLNTLGLNLRVGLSSEDPKVLLPSEPYDAYLSIYSPEGILLDRPHLGQIPPNRRKFFEISPVTRKLVANLDHLTVVHRVPSRLLSQGTNVEDEVELANEADYFLFRSLIEYSFPHGGNGSLIYETPPGLNRGTEGHRSSNTLTFTCQTVLSPVVNTCLILVHYSASPGYSRIASYEYALFSASGERVLSDQVQIGPFSIKVLDLAKIIPPEVVARERDPRDGLCAFTFVGTSGDAALLVLAVNTAPSLGGVAVEHTHPSQSYLFPSDAGYQRKTKADAQNAWRQIFSSDRR